MHRANLVFAPPFQSTLPRGERRNTTGYTTCMVGFQSTLPRGERLTRLQISLVTRYFNPRSRVGSDPVSIKMAKEQALYFNPRSRVGSDSTPQSPTAFLQNFNPRSRVGSDTMAIHFFRWLRGISIHAPAWGATSIPVNTTSFGAQFQSTLPRGERPVGAAGNREPPIFQSTLPRGERQQKDTKSNHFFCAK